MQRYDRGTFLCQRSRRAEEAPSCLQRVSILLPDTLAVANVSCVSRHHSKCARLLLSHDMGTMHTSIVPCPLVAARGSTPELLLSIVSLSLRILLTANMLVCVWARRSGRMQRSPNTHQRSGTRSSSSGLHHAKGSKPATDRYSSNASLCHRSSSTVDANFLKIDSAAVTTASQCGSDPEVYTRNTDHGIMMHMVQKHGGQPLIQESVAQLRQLDRAACVH